MTQPLSDWNATAFFEDLLTRNRLALREGFVFRRVSGLDGFEEALSSAQTATAFCCVSDIADGYTELNNSPRTRRRGYGGPKRLHGNHARAVPADDVGANP